MADENLVVDAIQYSEEKSFKDRYRFFDTAAERNDFYTWLKESVPQERHKNFCKVEVTLRVETIREGS